MNWQKSHFIKSLTAIHDKPQPLRDEIAVVGRSNVGKSSLINALLSKKKLAKVSKTPGKTQLINFYAVDDHFYLVDLPGYGYANVSVKQRLKWESIIETYLKNNAYLKLLLLLIDCRHALMANDKMMLEWLRYYHINHVVILTKRDKLSYSKYIQKENEFKAVLENIAVIPFSIHIKKSHDMVKKMIEACIDSSH
jgi:GTP-binding protein